MLLTEHPKVKENEHKIDMSDLERDSIVMFQHKYYYFLVILCGLIVPTLIQSFWGVALLDAWLLNLIRIAIV
jgi:fatty-acid desaturase